MKLFNYIKKLLKPKYTTTTCFKLPTIVIPVDKEFKNKDRG